LLSSASILLIYTRQINQFLQFVFCSLKCFLGPGVPISWIMRMLQQIWIGFVDKTICIHDSVMTGHHSLISTGCEIHISERNSYQNKVFVHTSASRNLILKYAIY